MLSTEIIAATLTKVSAGTKKFNTSLLNLADVSVLKIPVLEAMLPIADSSTT